MNPTDLLLAESDVPGGFTLRDQDERKLVVDEGGGTADQAHRMYGKARFLGFGDAIWSEATVFGSVDAARRGWANLVEHHTLNPAYEDVREIAWESGDEVYVHAGTMRGKPGIWAAIRMGRAVHRFNTYGVNETDSSGLLRRQLSKQAPTDPRSVGRPVPAGGSSGGSPMPDGEMLPRPVTAESVIQMLHEAYLDGSLDEDGDVVYDGQYRIVLGISEQDICFIAYFRLDQGRLKSALLEYTNRVNDELRLPRASIHVREEAESSLVFDWCLLASDHVSKRSVITALRRFEGAIDRALSLDRDNVIG